VAKTVSVTELGHGRASRAIRDAQQEPVLVSKENRPTAWIVSAERLAQVAAARGEEAADTYQRVLELIAVELYREARITLGQGAKLAGMSLGDFINLCAQLQVPILWETGDGLAADVQAASAIADGSRPGA
jgi:predicted HTH domain antitoxin